MNNKSVITPLMTEKASQLINTNVYTFRVGEQVNKHQIKELLEKMYKVKVAEIRIAKKKGKTRRVGRRMKTITTPDIKVAYVYVKEGKINIFPQP